MNSMKCRPHGAQEYRGNGSHKWEEVTVDPRGAGHTYRLRVPGGWLYRTVATFPDLGAPNDDVVAPSTVFVPLPAMVGYVI